MKLTVNMKCFEIVEMEVIEYEPMKLTVNMKCFEIEFIIGSLHGWKN